MINIPGENILSRKRKHPGKEIFQEKKTSRKRNIPGKENIQEKKTSRREHYSCTQSIKLP